jgi:tol-pal system protein YbgF
MQGDVATPVAGLTSRMNSLSDDMRTVSQAVSDLAGQISKIQSQLTDMNNAIKVISSPPTAPPQQNPGGGAMSPAAGGMTAPVSAPPMSSQDLYQQALGDRNGGKLDLALQEFADYLKYYGNTELAPNAQFYIANIHYSQGAYEQAAGEFDMVLEKYPENSKTREAMMYKGLSLVRAGHKTQGADEFREIISRYPHTDQATQACSQLTSLGFHCPTPAGRGTAKKKKGL